jgi:hypothetical protein
MFAEDPHVTQDTLRSYAKDFVSEWILEKEIQGETKDMMEELTNRWSDKLARDITGERERSSNNSSS